MPLSNNVRKVTSENYPTDAGREGEAIFRRVYALAGSKLPIKRLWISSMEDAAIQQGFENLKDGAAYDNLFAASECRAKADWLIGMNGTRAFTKKYGRKQTIGRVQTPTLAMLTERQTKIQNFVKEPYYKVELSGAGVVAVSEQMGQEQDADTMQAACDGQCAVVGSIERKRVEKKPPKLYDLTTLQREANRYYGLPASQTLQALQELYEEKLVTYPRTDSQFVTEDMRKTVESLVLALDGQTVDVSCVINNSKVTDHHAILPTMQGAKCNKEKLSETKQKILSLIIWKLVQGESDLWTSDNLRGLFRNPTYTGATANGSRQIIAENCHEPYMTKEQFYALPCNMQKSENKISTRKKYKKPNPLAKRIICTCGRPLYWHKDKKTGEELFYCSYCRAHKENGKELKAPAASVYKKVIDAMEREHREEEKMYSAIQQGAGRKAIEAVRADSSMQMKTILAELNMEQFRRVPLYESYMADEITEEQYRAEVLDYEEAHRKLNEQLTAIMENTMVWERALSLRNPWIQQMEQYKTPEVLDRNFVKKYIEQVVVTFLGDRQAEISLTMKTQEWKQMLERIELEGTDNGTKK